MLRPLAVAIAALLLSAASAHAATFGSSLSQPSDAGFGCESALRPDPFTGAPVLVPTGHRTCTLRSNGRVDSNRNWSIAPGNGRITRYSVRSGRNPAPLRLTILTASSQFDPEGETSNFSCCTARRFGPTFRPRANGVTTRRANIRVSNVRRRDGRSFFDVIALSAMGPGTLPLHTTRQHFSFPSGAPITSFYYPHTRRGEPRPENNALDGIELLLRWTWRR